MQAVLLGKVVLDMLPGAVLGMAVLGMVFEGIFQDSLPEVLR